MTDTQTEAAHLSSLRGRLRSKLVDRLRPEWTGGLTVTTHGPQPSSLNDGATMIYKVGVNTKGPDGVLWRASLAVPQDRLPKVSEKDIEQSVSCIVADWQRRYGEPEKADD